MGRKGKIKHYKKMKNEIKSRKGGKYMQRVLSNKIIELEIEKIESDQKLKESKK